MVRLTRLIVLLLISSSIAEKNVQEAKLSEDEAFWIRQLLDMGSGGSMNTIPTQSQSLRTLVKTPKASDFLPAERPTVPQVEFVADISVNSRFVDFDEWLYFDGSDGSSGDELWRTNGIDTTLVKDINPGDASSSPRGFTPYKGYLYFSAYEESTGRELWRTNGVETTLVQDFVPGSDGVDTSGSGSSDPGGFTEFNGWLYFKVFIEEADGGRFTQTNDELWRTNGIDTERFAVLDSSYDLNYRSYELAVFDGYLY
jgi:ELWxxDGT repeat protein